MRGLRLVTRMIIICCVCHENTPAQPGHAAAPESAHANAAPRTTSRALLGNGRELIIEHQGREYRLRVTQQGKLILTA